MSIQAAKNEKGETLLSIEWTFDPETHVWVCGTNRVGSGVYVENDAWWGNVVIGRVVDVVGPHPNADMAKEKVEQVMRERLR